ncbi:MAG: gfo/Idh/MocA family oxidoreductase [Planctomycetaceae bacterium]|nr:MAG: gfo/Idh/MocA family oxidoreductase [Planctomycetaceae bacterium]
MTNRSSRRRFLQQAAVAGAALSFPAASWARVPGANERLRIASVGTGGKGWSDLTATAASPMVQVVALCDIDESKEHLGQAAEKYAAAKKFTDWRRLFDEHKAFDAVIVSTPDHMHAPISLPAMQLGKHVQCQKPLTHTVFEARQMRMQARKHNVVTQMGNQIQSHEAYRTAVKLVHDGVIGKVREVHSWQSGALGWILVDDRPAGSEPIPPTLHWDDWIGVAPTRPYLPKIYHSFNWRAWQDFSNGQLGDFGCHILDPVFMALKLTAPLSIEAEASPMNKEIWYKSSTVAYEFPGTEQTAGKTIKVTWYDGAGHLPPRAALGLPESAMLPGSGSILLGEKGSLVIPHVAMPQLLPAEKFADFQIPVVPARDHYVSWADACRGEDKTTSHFDYSGPLTETVLLGTIAIRLPKTKLAWNAERMELTGSPHAQGMLTKSYRSGWQPRWV